MSAEDLENYETEMELQLYREYKDIAAQFSYVVETERRFYLTNDVDLQPRNADGEVYFELTMRDAWVWDMYRPARFVKTVRVVTFKDVNIEELDKPELELPGRQVRLRRLTARPDSSEQPPSAVKSGRPQRASVVHRPRRRSTSVDAAASRPARGGMRVKDAVGRFGEEVAAQYLTDAGLSILDRNWRCRDGEIDIVAATGRCWSSSR